MLVKELLKNNKISLRTYNICKEKQWNSLKDICNYYNEYHTFEGIKNCGRRSIQELMQVCSPSFLVSLQEEDRINSQLSSILKSLTPLQEEVISDYILKTAEYLSIGLQDFVKTYLQSDISLFYEFCIKVLQKNTKIKENRSKNELNLNIFFDKVKHFIYEVAKIKTPSQLMSLKKTYLLKNIYPIETIPTYISKLGLLKVVDYLLTTPFLFDESKIKLFPKAFSFYQDSEKLKLKEVGKQMQVTHERVRQIRNQIIDEFFKKFVVIRAFDNTLLKDCKIQISGDFLYLTKEQITTLNERSHTNFTENFIYIILSIYLENFTIIGDVSDVIYPHFSKKKSRHNWRKIYLISKELAPYFDSNKFIEDFSLRKTTKNNKQYELCLKEYLLNFVSKPELVDRVIPLVIFIVKDEFDLEIRGTRVVFPRNTYKQIYEYAYEALDILAKPSFVKQISQKVRELYPKTNFTYEGIRSSLKREYGFIPIGRSSCFGLKKWETIIENFKGGTIRDIVKEYLQDLDNPQSLTEITKYVLQYRPNTNSKSILTNLKSEASDTFVFFQNSFVGLKGKKYSSIYILLPEKAVKKRTWQNSMEFVKNFIKENGRRPFSSDKDSQAIILYRWISVQKNLIKNGRVPIERKKLFQEIINMN